MLMSLTEVNAHPFANRYINLKRNGTRASAAEPDLVIQEEVFQRENAEQEALLDRIHEEEPSPERTAAMMARKGSARRTRKSRVSMSPTRVPSPQKPIVAEVEQHHQRSFYCEEINGHRVATEGDCFEEPAPEHLEYAGVELQYTDEPAVQPYEDEEAMAVGSDNLLQQQLDSHQKQELNSACSAADRVKMQNFVGDSFGESDQSHVEQRPRLKPSAAICDVEAMNRVTQSVKESLKNKYSAKKLNKLTGSVQFNAPMVLPASITNPQRH